MSFPQLNKNSVHLIKSVAVPLVVGGLAFILTRQSMQNFSALVKPQLSPPAFLFPIVWIVLYTLMGIAYYLVITSGSNEEKIQRAVRIYHLQLAVNFLWPTFFFNLQWYLFSFYWLVFLWILVAVMMKRFSTISKISMWINIPYFIWLTFAGYLNLGIFLLN